MKNTVFEELNAQMTENIIKCFLVIIIRPIELVDNAQKMPVNLPR